MTTKWVKRRRARLARMAVFIVALVVLLTSAYQLLTIYLEYKRGTDEYSSLAGEAEKLLETAQDAKVPDADGTVTEGKDASWKKFYDTMRRENEDYVGWIIVDDTKITYPIVQYQDNDYYLHHTFEHQENAAGTLFVDCKIKEGMEAKNVIVYGHNMKNGSMFANLKKYKDKAFYEGHRTFKVYTETGFYDYEVFSVYVTEPDSDTYTIGFAGDDDFMSYAGKMQKQSEINTGVSVNPEDRIITLSTCVNNNEDRLIVQARRLDF